MNSYVRRSDGNFSNLEVDSGLKFVIGGRILVTQILRSFLLPSNDFGRSPMPERKTVVVRNLSHSVHLVTFKKNKKIGSHQGTLSDTIISSTFPLLKQKKPYTYSKMMHFHERRRKASRTICRSVEWLFVLSILCIVSTRDEFGFRNCHAFSFPKYVGLRDSISKRSRREISRDFYRTRTTTLSLYERDKEENDSDDEAPSLPALGPAGTSSNNHESGGDAAFVEGVADASTAATATIDDEGPTNTVQTFVNPKFALQYTCNICETKNRVIVSRQAYREGMVIAVCKGCNNKHWIADNLDPTLSHSNIEEYFQSKGQGDTVNRVTEEVYEIERVWGLKGGEMTDESGEAVLE